MADQARAARLLSGESDNDRGSGVKAACRAMTNQSPSGGMLRMEGKKD